MLEWQILDLIQSSNSIPDFSPNLVEWDVNSTSENAFGSSLMQEVWKLRVSLRIIIWYSFRVIDINSQVPHVG